MVIDEDTFEDQQLQYTAQYKNEGKKQQQKNI